LRNSVWKSQRIVGRAQQRDRSKLAKISTKNPKIVLNKNQWRKIKLPMGLKSPRETRE
jgi:hypothetical protein